MMVKKEDKLEIYILISLVLSFALIKLIDLNIFNLSSNKQLTLALILITYFLVLLFATNFSSSIEIIFWANFLLFLVLFNSSVLINPNFFNFNSKPIKIHLTFFVFTLLLLIINIIVLSYKLIILKEPYAINFKNKDNFFNRLLNLFIVIPSYLMIVFYKIRAIIPILSYIFMVFIIIFSFASLYEAYNNYSIENNLSEGLFYTKLEKNNSSIRATNFEPLYFSTCTFLNTNDGSILPKGDTIKLLVQIEMLIGHVINIIFIPTLLFFFLKFFDVNPSSYKNQSKTYRDIAFGRKVKIMKKFNYKNR